MAFEKSLFPHAAGKLVLPLRIPPPPTPHTQTQDLVYQMEFRLIAITACYYILSDKY